MDTAKLFISGSSQAVRLPKKYRFTGDEVGIKKMGNAVLLFPKDRAWETLLEGLSGFTDDFFCNMREVMLPQERDLL